MESATDALTTVGVYIERLRRSISDAVAYADLADSDPSNSPLLQLDLTSGHAFGELHVSQNPVEWQNGLVDVGNLLVDLALRYQEQTALLKTSHTSAILKHQVETKRLQEKLAHEQKATLTAIEAEKLSRAETALLEEQLRQQQLTSASKIDVLHQKIVHLEDSLHSTKEKLKQASAAEISSPATPSPIPTADSVASQPQQSPQVEPTATQHSNEVGASNDQISDSLENDLRMATELMRTEREKAEKLEVDLKRAHADLERLKAHLIQVQDETDLKEMEMQEEVDRLTAERDSLALAGNRPDAASEEREIDQSVLEEMTQELENAQIRIAELEEELETSKTMQEETISSLESSLVQLQADQQSELELHTVSLRNQVFSLKEQVTRTCAELDETERKAKEQAVALESLPTLQLKLSEEKSRREASEYENSNLRAALDDAAKRLSAATEGRDSLVAKPVVAKIFSTYLHPQTSASSKVELLHLMANILELSDEERKPLGIPLIKPPSAESSSTGLHALATPTRGLVSMLSSATGSMLTGSIQKSKQWLSWGAKQNEAPSQPSDTPAAPSLSDIWIKILLEGSEPAKPKNSEPEPQQESAEPPPEAFKVPFPMPSTRPAPIFDAHSSQSHPPPSTIIATSTPIVAPQPIVPVQQPFPIPTVPRPAYQSHPLPQQHPSSHSSSIPTTGAALQLQTPVQSTFQPRYNPNTYVPPPNRYESSQSPYLSQQQAMRNAFQTQIRPPSDLMAPTPDAPQN